MVNLFCLLSGVLQVAYSGVFLCFCHKQLLVEDKKDTKSSENEPKQYIPAKNTLYSSADLKGTADLNWVIIEC